MPSKSSGGKRGGSALNGRFVKVHEMPNGTLRLGAADARSPITGRFKPMKKYYYDLNIQVWEEAGEVRYSVIQEFDIDGKDSEVVTMGSEITLDRALHDVRRALQDLFNEGV
jgi:hypothetical protein